MSALTEISPADLASLIMSATGLIAGGISTYISLNAKHYEDQRQLRTTVGGLAEKILTLRGEEELLNVKALKGLENTEEFNTARSNNLRTQLTLARLMMDVLSDLKRSASAAEYEVLAYVLTTNNDPADDRFWRLALSRSTEKQAKLTILSQYAYAKSRFGRLADGEKLFQEALNFVKGEPVNEGYVHEARAKALHAIRKLPEAAAAFNHAEAAYNRMQDEGLRKVYLDQLNSARQTLGLSA